MSDELNFNGIPDHILHHFACDCAERALMREREAGREPAERSWQAIKVKRLWIEGLATSKKLGTTRESAWSSAYSAACSAASSAASSAAWHAASSAAWSADHSAASSAAWHAARNAAWSADHSAARSAASSAARFAAWNKERSWQKEHLSSLVEQHKEEQAALLGALLARKRQLQNQPTAIKLWQAQSEQTLFEEYL